MNTYPTSVYSSSDYSSYPRGSRRNADYLSAPGMSPPVPTPAPLPFDTSLRLMNEGINPRGPSPQFAASKAGQAQLSGSFPTQYGSSASGSYPTQYAPTSTSAPGMPYPYENRPYADPGPMPYPNGIPGARPAVAPPYSGRNNPFGNAPLTAAAPTQSPAGAMNGVPELSLKERASKRADQRLLEQRLGNTPKSNPAYAQIQSNINKIENDLYPTAAQATPAQPSAAAPVRPAQQYTADGRPIGGSLNDGSVPYGGVPAPITDANRIQVDPAQRRAGLQEMYGNAAAGFERQNQEIANTPMPRPGDAATIANGQYANAQGNTAINGLDRLARVAVMQRQQGNAPAGTNPELDLAQYQQSAQGIQNAQATAQQGATAAQSRAANAAPAAVAARDTQYGQNVGSMNNIRQRQNQFASDDYDLGSQGNSLNTGGMQLTPEIRDHFLQVAGGNKDRARQMAQAGGFQVPSTFQQ